MIQVWKQIKHDFNEVMHVVSEPKDMVLRTASSVREQLTAAAASVKNLDPDQFLLPESTSESESIKENEEILGKLISL